VYGAPRHPHFPTRRSSDLAAPARLELPVRGHVMAAVACGWLSAAGLCLTYLGIGGLVDAVTGGGAIGWRPPALMAAGIVLAVAGDRKSTRLNSSHVKISYA